MKKFFSFLAVAIPTISWRPVSNKRPVPVIGNKNINCYGGSGARYARG